ncbi:MAG: TPM domain-containing protein [Betaproteobacteria bacterium]
MAICLACILGTAWGIAGPGAGVARAAQDTGTYRILSYVVSIAPEPDGSWIADYHQEWEVTGGHIPWVTVGLPDHNYVIVSRGGAAAEVSRADYGSWSGVRVDLDRDYTTGDVFDFSFQVRQEGMGHRSGADAVEFEFVPGWYDRAQTARLEVRLKNPGAPEDLLYASPEPSQRTGEELIWTTSLGPGERFRVSFAFSSRLFPDLKARGEVGAGARSEGRPGTAGEEWAARRAGAAAVAVFALIGIAVVVLVVIITLTAATRGGYTGKRGIYYGTYFPIPPAGRPSWGSRSGRSSRSGGSGGESGGPRKSGGGGGFGGRAVGCACVSCACACVSCACACACAGGGGAGCARKFDGGRPAHSGAPAFVAASPEDATAPASADSSEARPEHGTGPGCEGAGQRTQDRRFSPLLIVLVAAGVSAFLFSNAAGCVWGSASSEPQQGEGPYDENVEVPAGDPAFPRLDRYWVVDPEGLVGARAVEAADQTLEALRAAGLAETVIVVQPGVKHPADWSTHYGRWLMLGKREGSLRNNGLVFLIVPDARPEEGRVWYSVGRGLPRLTSSDLGPLMEEAASYANAGDLDGAVVSIARNIDDILRRIYGEGEH